MFKTAFRSALFFIFLRALSSGFAFDDGSNKVKQEDDEATTVSVERAKEMSEHENYLQDKQDMYEKLRGMSATQTRLKQLREGEKQDAKEKKPETTQQKFLKEKSKTPEEEKEEAKKKKPKEEKEEENKIDLKKKKQEAEHILPQVKSLDDEDKKKNHFYKIRLLVDYRTDEVIRLKGPRKLREENANEGGYKAVEDRDRILDNVPFLRDMTLSPYALEEEKPWERWD